MSKTGDIEDCSAKVMNEGEKRDHNTIIRETMCDDNYYFKKLKNGPESRHKK